MDAFLPVYPIFMVMHVYLETKVCHIMCDVGNPQVVSLVIPLFTVFLVGQLRRYVRAHIIIRHLNDILIGEFARVDFLFLKILLYFSLCLRFVRNDLGKPAGITIEPEVG